MAIGEAYGGKGDQVGIWLQGTSVGRMASMDISWTYSGKGHS